MADLCSSDHVSCIATTQDISQPCRPAVVASLQGVSDDGDHIVAFQPVGLG
jgi:hypothetical protein